MNELLHRLTNRTGDFETESFNKTNFAPVKHPFPEILALMHLDSTEDYFVKNYLLNLQRFPDILSETPWGGSLLQDLTPPPPKVLGAHLVSTDREQAGISASPSWPPAFELDIRKDLSFASPTARSTYGPDSVVFPIQGAVKILRPVLPSNISLRGDLRPSSWPDTPISIRFSPPFPWEHLASLMGDREDIRNLLQRKGWVPDFHRSSGSRKVALVTSALISCLPS